jgi:uncharacterized protein (TIGR02266 family)
LSKGESLARILLEQADNQQRGNPMKKYVPKKVLLVDDVRLFLEVTKSFFSRENFQLTIVQGGLEALKVARALRPDLVIMNRKLRDLGGDECCRRIKADPEIGSTPVILLYDEKDADGERLSREAGCDHLLKKPFQRQQLLDLARSCLQVTARATPRLQTRMLLRYGAENRHQLHDYSVNLSVGGLFLETSEILPADSLLTLEFLVPGGGAPITAKGRVTWVNPADGPVNPELPAGFGIRFLDLEPGDEWLIRNFLQSERTHQPAQVR